MHSARAEVPAGQSIRLGWRVVDLLISIRRARLSRLLARARGLFFVAPGLALVCLLAYGIGQLGWDSLHTYNSFLGVEGSVSTTQYSQVVQDPLFRTVLVRTLLMAITTAAIAVTLAVPFALVLARTRRNAVRLALLIVVFIPYLTGDITRTFGWLALLGPNGPIGWLAQQLGSQPPVLIGTLWAVGMGSVQVLLPAAVVILLPAALRLDPELESAGSTLGARRRQVFLRIVLPQLRTACFGALTACWAFAMGEFADPAILGQGVKDYLANYLQDRYLEIGDVPLGAAAGMLLLLLVTLGGALIIAVSRAPRRRRLRG